MFGLALSSTVKTKSRVIKDYERLHLDLFNDSQKRIKEKGELCIAINKNIKKICKLSQEVMRLDSVIEGLIIKNRKITDPLDYLIFKIRSNELFNFNNITYIVVKLYNKDIAYWKVKVLNLSTFDSLSVKLEDVPKEVLNYFSLELVEE